MTTSGQSHRPNYAPPLSPSPASNSLLGADQDTLLSASNKAILSSLECLNDYIQKHYDQFVARESLDRNRLVASFAEKEKNYERQISILKAIRTDIASLLAREQTTNEKLREALENATGSIATLCKLVTDANFVFVDRKRGPHEIKQEEKSEESTIASDIVLCPNATIFSLLSQIESVVTEMNTQNSAPLPSPVDILHCHSIVEALGRVADSLLVTQHAFGLLQGDLKSVGAARVDAERQSESLREKIILLQEELEKTKSSCERTSQELAAARLEMENHICRAPASAYPTPAIRDDIPVSLPSPPLEKRDSRIPDDILQDTGKIRRKTDQALPKRILPENSPSPQTPITEAGPSSTSASTSCERRRISFNDAVKRVQANPASSATQSGPSESPTPRDDQQTAGPSMPPPSTPVQGIKRTSNGVHKRQDAPNEPPPSPSTSALTSSSISDKTNNTHPQKKRRINGASETPRTKVNATHTSTTSAAGPSSASSSKRAAVELPKTSASDLKSLKFTKKSQPSNPPSTAATSTFPSTPKLIVTPTKSDKSSMKPLDLAKKSPQERAALRKSK